MGRPRTPRVGLAGTEEASIGLEELLCHLYSAAALSGTLAAQQKTPDLQTIRRFALNVGRDMTRAAIKAARKPRR